MKYRKLVYEAVDEGNEGDVPAIHQYLIPKHYCTSGEVGLQRRGNNVLETCPDCIRFRDLGKRLSQVPQLI